MTVAGFMKQPTQKSGCREIFMMYAGIALISAIVIAIVVYCHFRGPVANSDVPVISEIGSWPEQDGLQISYITAEAVNPELGLFENRFLIRFHIKGTISPSKHVIPSPYRPEIIKAQLTARIISGGFDHNGSAHADILIVPIVGSVKDESYKQEDVPFDLTLEHVFQAMNWGPNTLDIKCGDKTASVTVLQSK